MPEMLMKPIRLPVLLLFFLTLASAAAALNNSDYRKSITAFSSSPYLQPYFRHAYGYAVFPRIVKGGAVVGAAYGDGRLYRRHRYMGESTMMQLSAGAQLGGQVCREIIFFKDREAYETFAADNFEFDAAASAVLLSLAMHARVGSAGHSAGMSTIRPRTEQFGGGYINGMAVFTHIRGGVMYEAVLAGQRFTFQPGRKPARTQ
jgi:lipid-binding SYLF domain-containing protein